MADLRAYTQRVVTAEFDLDFRKLNSGRRPYLYQEKVAAALWSRRNLVLRAPTGSGKTLAVLAPFLLDRDHRKLAVTPDTRRTRGHRTGPAAWRALGIPFEGHAQVDGRDHLIAGDGAQTSIVEAWATTPAEMSVPPSRCDGSVDLVRYRQWEWHSGFLARVLAKMAV